MILHSYIAQITDNPLQHTQFATNILRRFFKPNILSDMNLEERSFSNFISKVFWKYFLNEFEGYR
jgi:hypothetical protein